MNTRSPIHQTPVAMKSHPLAAWIGRRGLLVLVTIFLAAPAFAQTPKVAQAGMTWLNMPIGPRAAGMGDAYVGVANDGSSFFWNPAGYAFTEGATLFANRTEWIADMSISAAAISYDARRLGVIGFNITSVDWGTFRGTQRADNDAGYVETGDFSPTSAAIGLSYAYRISSEFGVGANVKYLHENLGSTRVGSFDGPEDVTASMRLIAVDFGTLYYVGFRDLRLGVSLRNFSNEKAYRTETFPLPMTLRFGTAMDVLSVFTTTADHRITMAADFLHSRDYSERLNLGAEYGFRDLLFLRGGYKHNYDIGSFTVGAGIQVELGGITGRIDYSFLQTEFFDAVNMFSLEVGF
jgi:hypothetical protein